MEYLRALLLLAVASTGGGAAAKSAPPRAAAPAVDESVLDRKIQPCDDFYQFACGGWIARTAIPADKASWSRGFSEIEERNESTLHDILDGIVAGKSIAPDPYGDLLGDFYGGCMDEARSDATSAAELAAVLARIDAVDSPDALARQLAVMHLEHGLWSDPFDPTAPLFRLGAHQDQRDATLVLAEVEQSGLGLPDRDTYLKDDPASRKLRGQYFAHVRTMLQLAGTPTSQASVQAATVVRIERRLAEASMARVDRRDPEKVYHRMDLDALVATAPNFHWRAYLAALGHPGLRAFNVAQPEFLRALSTLLGDTPLGELRSYLRWHAVHQLAPALSRAFVDEDFAFYQKTLEGVAVLPVRWKRCVTATTRALGEAVARPFVRRTFGSEGKRATLEMVHAIEAAMGANLAHLGWMDDASRRAALEKLTAINNKIGFPEPWRRYDRLVTARGSYLRNGRAASAFEAQRDLDKIGRPVDRSEWLMPPSEVNAYYEPPLNEISFPAGILQPPFYDRAAALAINFGGIGMVMGHELTHGFDDEGRKYDARGNVHEWWTPSVSREFERRAACVATQFDGYVAVDDLHLNGKLTLGENIADLGGLKLAHAAWAASRPKTPARTPGGFSDEQLFYLGFAQSWCSKERPELDRVRVLTDEHAPSRFRVNGPLSNLPEFGAAFQCHAGQPMVRADACTVW